MFRFILLFLGICLLPCLPIKAQEEKWEQLEKERNTINTQIQKGDLLINELKINANRLILPENVEYQHWEKYFYNFNKKEANSPTSVLKAVIIKTEKDGTNIYHEYMFDNEGNCIFYSESRQDYKNAIDERLRIYIDNGKPIKWYRNDTDITYDTEKPEKITQNALKIAQKLKEKFLKQLEEK